MCKRFDGPCRVCACAWRANVAVVCGCVYARARVAVRACVLTFLGPQGQDPGWEVGGAVREEEGEQAAAALLKDLGATLADQARNLAYRLYTICERKKWAEEARAYNGLVLAWPELEKLAASNATTATTPTQASLEL